MSEFLQGPVNKWEPQLEESELIGTLLESKDEVDRVYGEAYRNRCFVVELSGSDDSGIAAVGDLDAIIEHEFRTGEEVDWTKFSISECTEWTFPGVGNTRAERIKDGMDQVLEARWARERGDLVQ